MQRYASAPLQLGVSIVEKPFLDFALMNSVRRSLAQSSGQHINTPVKSASQGENL